MKPTHHIDDSTLVADSAASLPLALSLVVTAHLSLCAPCRARLATAEAIGGALLEEAATPATQGAGDASWRASMLASLDRAPVAVPRPDRAGARLHPDADGDLLPACVWPYFGKRISTVRWRFAAPSVRLARARGLTDGSLLLFKVAPGYSMPVHSHGRSELTLVLQGAYRDRLGHFGHGDIADVDSDIEHQPITDPGPACVCLAATDAPLRFVDWIPRLLQPLHRL